MNKLQIVTIRDRQLDAYMTPWFCQTTGQAIRSFQDELANPQSPMNKHPDDYDLFHLGEWDELTGEFKNLGAPKKIADGKTLSQTN